MSGPVWAASYLDIYGVVHDPIQNRGGGDSPYSGSNQEPSADLDSANLSNAILPNAYLSSAILTDADLDNAILTNTWLYSADLGDTSAWSTATWTGAKYSLNAVDNSGNPIPDTIFPVGMDQAWRDAAGMVAVPEPTTALLFTIGLAGLATRRRA